MQAEVREWLGNFNRAVPGKGGEQVGVDVGTDYPMLAAVQGPGSAGDREPRWVHGSQARR